MENINKFIKDNAYILILIAFLLFYVNSCTTKKSVIVNTSNVEQKLDSTLQVLEQERLDVKKRFDLYEKKLVIYLQIENLKAEKRSVLNINQIFLTKKRPDERVMEIDTAMEELNIELDEIK
jgi:hypothetical protein